MFSQKSPQRWLITGMAGAMFIVVSQLGSRLLERGESSITTGMENS